MAAVGGNVAAEFNDPVSANWYIAAWITAITIGFTIWYVNWIRVLAVRSNDGLAVQTRICLGGAGFSLWDKLSASLVTSSLDEPRTQPWLSQAWQLADLALLYARWLRLHCPNCYLINGVILVL